MFEENTLVTPNFDDTLIPVQISNPGNGSEFKYQLLFQSSFLGYLDKNNKTIVKVGNFNESLILDESTLFSFSPSLDGISLAGYLNNIQFTPEGLKMIKDSTVSIKFNQTIHNPFEYGRIAAKVKNMRINYINIFIKGQFCHLV
jgi:hypothetical protein